MLQPSLSVDKNVPKNARILQRYLAGLNFWIGPLALGIAHSHCLLVGQNSMVSTSLTGKEMAQALGNGACVRCSLDTLSTPLSASSTQAQHCPPG